MKKYVIINGNDIGIIRKIADKKKIYSIKNQRFIDDKKDVFSKEFISNINDRRTKCILREILIQKKEMVG